MQSARPLERLRVKKRVNNGGARSVPGPPEGPCLSVPTRPTMIAALNQGTRLVFFQSATVVRNSFVPDNERRCTLRAADGKLFIGKNDYCCKSQGKKNTAWLVTELVAAEYAAAAGLRLPELRLLTDGASDFLGSESCGTACPSNRGRSPSISTEIISRSSLAPCCSISLC